jgi:transglutaminase superfamily protein
MTRHTMAETSARARVPQTQLEYYAQSSSMTALGEHAERVASLPHDVAGLARIIQGLVVHEYVAADFYGFPIPEQRRSESHVRPAQRLLDEILAIDSRPLSVARPAEKRLVGVCHHPMLLLVAILRAQGVPARARCGFGSYFNPGFFEDHWVCEYWNATAGRWALADPQFDQVWCERLHIDHNTLDVPRDRFLVASDAWIECRADANDPAKFGIFRGDMRGLWFIAGDLVRDAAALNKVEMLPWDVWGGMLRPNEKLNEDQLVFFDQLAALTSDPDESFDDLRALYATDERVRMPGTVFNAILNRPEQI